MKKTLYGFCEELNKRGLRFGMSNGFSQRGIDNLTLINWCNANNWNVHSFKDMKYSSCGKGNSKTNEVFITNY